MKPALHSVKASRLCVLGALILAIVYLPRSSFFPRTAYGPILFEKTSSFSNLRVRGSGSMRHLLFVDESGREGLQTSLDLADPGKLQIPYTRALFASLLFRNPQDKVLLVGLGGGGMLRFLEHHFPETVVEAVEIDPVVVSLAAQYFGTTQKPGIRIHTEDAFVFLEQPNRYDAIYMDAFLRPSVDGAVDSRTSRLKTKSFLRTIRERLLPGGVLACNLVARRKSTPADLAALREVFPMVKTIRVKGTGNLVAIAGNGATGRTREEWISHGESVEKRLPVGIPFASYAKRMR